MEEMHELTDDQRLYLKTIFDHFHSEGKWPTYLEVENAIRDTHPEKWSEFDLIEMRKSLPVNFASGFSYSSQYGQEASFIVPALYYFPEAKEEIADFIRVVRFCVEKMKTSKEERPVIKSEDLSQQLQMQPLTIRKVGLLLPPEPFFDGGGSNMAENWWYINLKRGRDGIRRFEGVETFEQYLQKRTPVQWPDQVKKPVAGNIASYMATDIAPSYAVPSYNQYHFGDQYNITGNSGEINVKSPTLGTITTKQEDTPKQEDTKKVPATKNERANPWVSGSFYLFSFIVVLAAVVVLFKLLPWAAFPITIGCAFTKFKKLHLV